MSQRGFEHPGASDRERTNELFSVREAVLGPGEPDARFRRCLVEAKRFIDTTSVASVLDSLFDERENRRSVGSFVRDTLHVGFIFPDEALTTASMSRESSEAGFCSDHCTFTSTVLSRHLGTLVGRPQIPTTIFMASASETRGRSGSVEVFIPAEEKKLLRKWIEEEVGTHVGLTLSNASAFPVVHGAFLAEGFGVPPFMRDQPISNPDLRIAAVYYEKPHGSGVLRMEVILPMGETGGALTAPRQR